MPDPYTTLGVKRDASSDEIKRAFRKAAKAWHPDTNQNKPYASAKFAELNSAYEILGDEKKRRAFDRGEIDQDGKPRATHSGFEHAGGPGGGPGGMKFDFGFGGAGPFGGGSPFGGGKSGDPRDAFSDLFRKFEQPQQQASRGHGGRAGPPNGEDAEIAVEVALETIASGGGARISLPDGRTVEITIPKGSSAGTVMRLKGQGHPSPYGTQNGDALVSIRYARHAQFTPDGADLRVNVPVPIRDAVLGGAVRVPTLSGEVEVTIPAWTSGGKTLRLKGKGLPLKERTGDLFVTLGIDLGAHDPDIEGFFRRKGV